MATLQGDGKMIFAIFIGAIIAVVFLGSIADSIQNQANVVTVTNRSMTTNAAGNGTVALSGRTYVAGSQLITFGNASDDVDLSPNMTIASAISSAGVQSINLITNDSLTAAVFDLGQRNGTTVNVSYQYEASGYLQNSGARSMATLVVIIGALAILVYIVVILWKPGTSLSKLLKI